MRELIYRDAAIDALGERPLDWNDDPFTWGLVVQYDEDMRMLEAVPSVEPTLYGYNIHHLELIARILQKENLPPERVAEALTDIERIIAIINDEFEETFRVYVKGENEDVKIWT